MDPISALSLAASVIAVIQISREAAQICTDLVETGSVSQYRAAEDTAVDIEKSLVALRGPLKAANGPAQNRDELLDIANKCAATANELKLNLSKLKKDPDGGFRDALKKTFRAMTKKKEIEQSRKDLNDYEKALNTRILVRLNTNAAKTSEGYDEVRMKLADLGIAIENGGQAVAQKVSEQLQRSDRSAKFLESLRFPDIFSRQEQINDAHRKTFEWIFQEPNSLVDKSKITWASFTVWLEGKQKSNPNIYWIHGKPGAGKSTLLGYLLDDARTLDSLRVWCGQDAKLLMPSFFFWNTGSGLQKTVQGLLRSVIYQLLVDNESTLSELLDDERNKRGLRLNADHAWTERRLVTLLNEILRITALKGMFICFFLDGLDEYDGDVDQLKTWIFDLSTYQHVKVCVSSRWEEAFRQGFAGMPQLRLQDLTRDDIELYTRDRLESKLPDSLESQSPVLLSHRNFTKQGLIRRMLESADGVFLWIKLVARDMLTGIEAGESLQQLHARLEETPLQILDLYAHMLEKLPRSLRPQTTKYLSLVLAPNLCADAASNPNVRGDVDLLGLACCQDGIWKMICASDLSFKLDSTLDQSCKRLESTIVSCCAGLVEIEESRHEGILKKHMRSLNFIHRSVIDFLQTNGQSWVPKTAYTPAVVQLARANIGRYSLVESESPGSYKPNAENPLSDFVWDAGKDFDAPDAGRFPSPISTRRTSIDATIMMEHFVFNQNIDEALLGEYEEVVTCLCQGLKIFSPKLWDDRIDVTRWRPREICSVDEALQYEDIPFLATLGFQRAIRLIEQMSAPKPIDLDRIIDCVSCSFSRGSQIVLKNLVSIARTAFDRGADFEHTIIVQFYFFRPQFWLEGTGEDPLCKQSSWPFLIWRFVHSDSSLNEGFPFDHIDCVGPFIEFCLSKDANPDATCLIPIRENEKMGYFIHELSISTLIRSRVKEPFKAKFLQILEEHNAKSIDRIAYFVDTDYTVYQLNEAQSDLIADTVRERDDVDNFYTYNWGASGEDKIDETLQLAGKRVRETLKDSPILGSLKHGLVIGDDTTYEYSQESPAE